MWILKRWVNGSIIQEYRSIYFVQDISRGWLATVLAVFQYNRPISFPTLQHRPETDSVSQKKETSRSYRSLFCSQESATVLSEEKGSRPYSSQVCFIWTPIMILTSPETLSGVCPAQPILLDLTIVNNPGWAVQILNLTVQYFSHCHFLL